MNMSDKECSLNSIAVGLRLYYWLQLILVLCCYATILYVIEVNRQLPLKRVEKRQTAESIVGGPFRRDIEVFFPSQRLIPYSITVLRRTERSLWNIVFKLWWVVPSWLVTSYNVCAVPRSILSCVFTDAEMSRGLPHYLSKMPRDTPGGMVAKVEVAHFIVPAKQSTLPNSEELYSGTLLAANLL